MNLNQAQVIHTAPAAEPFGGQIARERLGKSIAAVVVIALAIAGLAGAFARTMAEIGEIVLGASILIESGFFRGSAAAVERSEWLASQFFGGFAGMILGLLALVGVAPEVLSATGIITFGTALLFTSLAKRNFNGHALVGIEAIVLGILALLGLDQPTLVLAALLCLGTRGQFTSLLHHAQNIMAHPAESGAHWTSP